MNAGNSLRLGQIDPSDCVEGRDDESTDKSCNGALNAHVAKGTRRASPIRLVVVEQATEQCKNQDEQGDPSQRHEAHGAPILLDPVWHHDE